MLKEATNNNPTIGKTPPREVNAFTLARPFEAPIHRSPGDALESVAS